MPKMHFFSQAFSGGSGSGGLKAFEIRADFLFKRFIAGLPGELIGPFEPLYRILIDTLPGSTATCPKVAFRCI